MRFIFFKLGKEYKVAIDLTEKVFDAALNNPSSSQFLELKELLEKSVSAVQFSYTKTQFVLLYTVLNGVSEFSIK